MSLREQLDQIKEDIELHEAKIRDNCNIIGQLKKEDMALRTTIKLLKTKRTQLIFKSLESAENEQHV
jgi:hypothetical protein